MIVQEVMSTGDTVSVAADETVTFAARLMSWAHVKQLPVCRRHSVVGIFTEEDYLRYRAEIGLVPADVPVSRFMTSPVFTVRPQDPVEAAIGSMISRGISCVPVVDERYDLIGVLTGGDVLAADVRSARWARSSRPPG